MPETLSAWGSLLWELARAFLVLVGSYTAGAWVREWMWPKPPHRCLAHLRLRGNVFVNADPDLLVTQGEDGVMEIEGFAIMPRTTYKQLATAVGWEAPEC